VKKEMAERENELIREMPEPLLSVKELALWLGMSNVWTYKATQKNLIPFIRVGEAIRFDPKEIRSYLNNRRGITKSYGESRNPKKKKKDVHLVGQQEGIKSD